MFLGNILTERDIRILAVVLAKHLPYLQNSGLNLKQGVRITKEEVVIHLRKIDRRELAEILSEDKGNTSIIILSEIKKTQVVTCDHYLNL